jgi:hypothetical protein
MPWREPLFRPTERQLGEFAVCAVLALAALATVSLWRGHGPEWIAGYLAAAAAVGMLYLVRRSWLAPVFTALWVVTWPIAWVVQTLILAAVYFALMTPLAILFRLLGRDALDRRFGPRQNSYWREKAQNQDPRDYLQQF